MDNWNSQNFSGCCLGEKRLNRRAVEIAQAAMSNDFDLIGALAGRYAADRQGQISG